MERRVEQVRAVLEDACQRGIEVRITTKTPGSGNPEKPDSSKLPAAIESLASHGCTLECRELRPASYLVIDQELVWFGSIPPLAFPKKDDCSVRFHSAEVAHELIGEYDTSASSNEQIRGDKPDRKN